MLRKGLRASHQPLLRSEDRRLRLCFTLHVRSITQLSTVGSEVDQEQDVKQREKERDSDADIRRKRKSEWKRRQRGQTFLDNLIVTVHGGKGGDGCVAFHREKFVPRGPPSGGNGGRGGDVYLLPTPGLTTLSSVSPRIRAAPGANGGGTWRHGASAPPTVVRVPVGTVVHALPDETAHDSWGDEGEEGLELEERRKRRWVHYPGAEEGNAEGEAFLEAERALVREDRERRLARRAEQAAEPLHLDLSAPFSPAKGQGTAPDAHLGYLVARGGTGGLGNPSFATPTYRAPKFAMRGRAGTRVTLSLELKLLADVGLVGAPNAGKSTLLRALTGGRARTEVAGYAFTTLNPAVGVVRLDGEGNVLGGPEGGAQVVEETREEEARFDAQLGRGEFADARAGRDQDALDALEAFRFTVADNPGLLAGAGSDDIGLGHGFLRSIERAHALAYVVDLSSSDPAEQLLVLQRELEAYQRGLSAKARLVVANKADVLGGEGPESVQAAMAKLAKLEAFVRVEMGELDVLPVSAKFGENLAAVTVRLRRYVEEARAKTL